MNKAALFYSTESSWRFVCRAVSMLSIFTLLCALLPLAAFADSGQQSSGASLQSSAMRASVLSPQASSKVKSAKKTTKKSAAFAIKKYRKYKKFTYTTGEWRYGKPVIKGSSKVVKKMNKSLNARYKAHSYQAGIVDMAKDDDSPLFKGANYHFTADTKATYNKKGYVSFRYKWDWFAGGVHNGGYYGDVFSLKTGKKLNVSQVVAGNASQVKRKIISAIKKQLKLDVYSRVSHSIMSKKISEFEFFLSGGKVVVVIDPYTWPGQRSALTVKLKGNYA